MVTNPGVGNDPDRIAGALAETGWVEVAHFLPDALLDDLRRENDTLHAAGALRPALIGHGESERLRPDVRGDLISWIDTVAPSAPQSALLALVEDLRLALNRRLFLGLFDFEACHCRYPVGALYHKHLDRFRRSQRRVLTLVIYLNEGWTPENGGVLRLHLDDASHHDVLPTGGKAILFLSERFPHEVLPATRERLAISGWYRRRP